MFRALDCRNDEGITILSPAWVERVPEPRGPDEVEEDLAPTAGALPR